MSKGTKRVSKKAKILALLKEGKPISEVVKTIKVKPSYAYYIRWMNQKTPSAKAVRTARKKASRLMQEVTRTHEAIDAAVQREKELASVRARDNKLLQSVKQMDLKLIRGIDVVNSPPHYKTGGIETIDFIEAKDLNYRLGNVIKYISRAGKKVGSDPIQDLEKARFYLEREIQARRDA